MHANSITRRADKFGNIEIGQKFGDHTSLLRPINRKQARALALLLLKLTAHDEAPVVRGDGAYSAIEGGA